MFCKNCGCEINNENNFCQNCGYDLNAEKHDLYGVTKISTPLFILFSVLTLGIYPLTKLYRITGDLGKIIVKEETVSPIIITIYILLSIKNILRREYIDSLSMPKNIESIYGIILILSGIIGICLYCYIIYRTLNNIRKIALTKQNKDLKYNKFLAFIFNIVYINFVINTYDKRLIEVDEKQN